jgi:hypothetical protein
MFKPILYFIKIKIHKDLFYIFTKYLLTYYIIILAYKVFIQCQNQIK